MYTMELEKLIESYDGSEESFQKLIIELKKLIKTIIYNDIRLQQVSSNSYIHQLGFEKYTLYSSPFGKNIRLHFWPEPNVFKDDIHSHCASFTSVILNGYIKQRTFELTNDIDQKKYSYYFDPITNLTKAKLIGNAGYKIQKVTKLLKKEYYYQNFNILHQVFETDKNTLTISIWDKKEHPAVVLKELTSEAQDCTYTTKLSDKLINERFQLFLELLK